MPIIILLSLLLFTPLTHAIPPPIQLATKFHDDINIENYWVSEKLDGIRAYWNGQQLLSRQGNIFHAPAWFTEGYPAQHLDGELWIGRGKFELVSGTVRSQGGYDDAWREVSFMIFDLPSSKAPFTQRLATMQQLVDNSPSPFLKMIKQEKIATHRALQQKLDDVINGGGEGLMLHHVDAYYQVKRSQDLMKIKRYDDADAVVLDYIAGQGKHLGRMGALVVKNADGLTFKIGTGFSDAE